MVDLLVAGSCVGLWLLAYAGCRVASRPAQPVAGPAGMELGPEPPAVVSMLVNGWSTSVDTAESTLLDLAAAGWYELRQPDADPARTTIHLDPAPRDESGLRPYERQVLERVRGLAASGVVPVTALTFRDENESKAWNKRLRTAVVSDARAAGLSERRFGRTMMSALFFGATVTAVVCGVAAVHATHVGWTFLVSIMILAVLTGVVQRIGERGTPAGLEAAGRWLGVQAWLRNHEQFAELPPSAVAVWDRYLAYGAALGVTRRASDVLDLETGGRRRLWSSYRGGWRRIRVRYPKGAPWYGGTARALFVQAALFSAIGAVILAAAGPASRYSLPGFALLAAGVYVLARTIADLARTEEVTGEVLARHTWRANNNRPWLDYLVVDDGSADRTTAWGLPSAWGDGCRDGDVVTITARPWSRRVLTVSRVSRSARPRAAETGDERIGPLVTDVFGEVREMPAGPLPVSAADVARVVGEPVRVERHPQRVEFRSEADNALLLRAEWAGGRPGRIAYRANMRGAAVPLPGIGDEAYASGHRVVLRVGGLVVLLIATGRGRAGTPHLPWLLSRCETGALAPTE